MLLPPGEGGPRRDVHPQLLPPCWQRGPDPGEGVLSPGGRSGSILPSARLPSSGPPAGDPRQAPAAPASHVSRSRWPAPLPLGRALLCLAGTSLLSGRGWHGPPPRVTSPVIAPARAPSGPRLAPSSGPSPLVAPGRPLASRWGLFPAAEGLGLEFLLASRPPYLRGVPPPPSGVTPPFPLPVAGDGRFPLSSSQKTKNKTKNVSDSLRGRRR